VQVGGEPLGQGAESRRHVLAQPLLHRHEVVLAAGAVRQAEDVRLGGEGQMAAHLREEVARCPLGLELFQFNNNYFNSIIFVFFSICQI